MQVGQELVIKGKKFVITSIRAEHEEHITAIATWSGRTYLVRTFFKDYEKTLADYKVLKKAGINMAKICFHDDEAKIIAFDYFPESDVLEDLSKGKLSELHFQSMLSLYRFARFSKISLAWEPQNFMLRGSQMFYLPTKWEPMNEHNKFEQSGIRGWFLGKEGHAILTRKGYDTSNLELMQDAAVNKQILLMTIAYW